MVAGPDAVVMGAGLVPMVVIMPVVMGMTVRVIMGVPMRVQSVVVRHGSILALYGRKITGRFMRMNPGSAAGRWPQTGN
jgi:hypothetical protein